MRKYLVLLLVLCVFIFLGIFIRLADSRYTFTTEGLNAKVFIFKPKLLFYDWLMSRETKNKFDFYEKIQINLTNQQQPLYLIRNNSNEVFESASFEGTGNSSKINIFFADSVFNEVNKYKDKVRLDADVLAYMCLRNIYEATGDARDNCFNNAYLIKKQFKIGRFIFLNNINILSDLFSPDIAYAGCGGYVDCGSMQINCSCSDGGGSCSNKDGPCGTIGTCRCGPDTCGNTFPHDCPNTSVQANCKSGCGGGQCVTGSCSFSCDPVDGSWSGCSGCDRTCDGASCGGTCGNKPSCAQNGSWSACTVGCTRSCSASCGGTCGAEPTCVVDGSWSGWSPNDCNNRCGQDVTRTCSALCGGTCPNDGYGATKTCSNADNGAPNVPVCNNLGTTVAPAQVAISWSGGGPLTDDYQYRVDGGGATTTVSQSANVSVVGGGIHNYQALSRNTTCGTDSSAWSTACTFCYETQTALSCGWNTRDCQADVCHHCAPTISVWGACDGSGKRHRTCTSTDSMCDGNDSLPGSDCQNYFAANPGNCPSGNCPIVGTTQSEDCTGSISGYVFDASDCNTCGACASTLVPSFVPTTLLPNAVGQTFTVSGFLLPLGTPVTIGPGNGQYSINTYIAGAGNTLTFDFSNLFTLGIVGSAVPKLYCNSATPTVPAPGQANNTFAGNPTTNSFGFFRLYGGWWQVLGGSVHADATIKSTVPASLALLADQRLIKPDANSRDGIVTYGTALTLGSNPNVLASGSNRVFNQTYQGLKYNFAYFDAKMKSFTPTNWVNGNTPPAYVDGGLGYMLVKYTGALPLNISALAVAGGNKYVILVPGQVNITGNITVANGSFLSIISSGDIHFTSPITTAQGWYLSDGQLVIDSTGNPGTEVQFSGAGSFVGWSGFSLSRDRGATNNSAPAQLFTYRDDLLSNAPVILKYPYKFYAPFNP